MITFEWEHHTPVPPSFRDAVNTRYWFDRALRFARHDRSCYDGLTRDEPCSCGLDELIKAFYAEQIRIAHDNSKRRREVVQ